MKKIIDRPIALQSPGTGQELVKNRLSLKSGALILILLFALVIPGCARMKQRVQEQAAFKSEMSSGQITENRLSWHAERSNIIARKESKGEIKIGNKTLLISRWRIKSYPTYEEISFVTFWNGKYQSIYSVPDPMKSIRRR